MGEEHCLNCGATVSPVGNFCASCGARLKSAAPYVGKTAPVAIHTQPIRLTGWPQPTAAPLAMGNGLQAGYTATGVAGPEAEVAVADTSGSTNGKGQRGTIMDDIKGALRAHALQKMHIDRADLFALVGFSDDAEIRCGWTPLGDPAPLLAAINDLTPDAGTCFKSGLEKAEELFATCPPAQGVQPLRKILFLSDGKNNIGDPAPVSDRLKKAGVIIQAIGFAATEQEVDADRLRQIVSVIDGKPQYWFCRSAQELTRTFKALSGKTRIFPSRP